MIIQLEMTRMKVTNQRIEGNSEFDKNEDNGNETSENGNRRKKQESKDYSKIYIYQCVHYKKCRKRAKCSTSKRKTRNGKFLQGPAKDDDTYISSDGSTSEWGSVVGSPLSRRMARKVPKNLPRKVPRKVSRNAQAVIGRRKKNRSVPRKVSKLKNKKRVLAIQGVWSGQAKKRYLECRVLVQETIPNGSRVWDAERTGREGGGGPARVAKFRDRSNQQLGSAADVTPVVL
jgi:hypothetical protein